MVAVMRTHETLTADTALDHRILCCHLLIVMMTVFSLLPHSLGVSKSRFEVCSPAVPFRSALPYLIIIFVYDECAELLRLKDELLSPPDYRLSQESFAPEMV